MAKQSCIQTSPPSSQTKLQRCTKITTASRCTPPTRNSQGQQTTGPAQKPLPEREDHKQTRPISPHHKQPLMPPPTGKGNFTKKRFPPPPPIATQRNSGDWRPRLLSFTTTIPMTRNTHKTIGDGRLALPTQDQTAYQLAHESTSTMRRHQDHAQHLEPGRFSTTVK